MCGCRYDRLSRATMVTNTLAGTGVPGPVTFSQQFDLADNRTRLAASIGGTASAGADFSPVDGRASTTSVT
jgi:hypothetical protein